MHYSNGNYEAFVRPRKPKKVEGKSAYLVGSGLASLAAAAFLIRDGQMSGKNIHIYEELDLPGGSLDGWFFPGDGFLTRGGREMEDHFECLWDLFRSVPSLEIEGASVLDEFYWLNEDDPNSSNCRLIHNRGERVATDGEYTLSKKAQKELVDLFLKDEDSLEGKKISDVFSKDFFESNFWWYWSSMFAFEKWHSAIEMHRYLLRFIHHIDGLPDFTALKFTKYNQYESLVLPLVKFLQSHEVDFIFNTKVLNIEVDVNDNEKIAKRILLDSAGKTEEVDITVDDLVFVTNGSITESTTRGSHNSPAPINNDLGASWKLWENLAKQSDDFGNPDVFCKNLPEDSWFISGSLTMESKEIEEYITKLTHREIHTGKVVSGGIITIVDSNWMMSFAMHRQPHFKAQKPEQAIMWVYGLLSGEKGNYVKKKITECSGKELTEELLYHLGVPEDRIEYLAENECNFVPAYMPFITSYFMLRSKGDRPLVVPEGSKNLAFIGNFADTMRDTVFTTEYSVRTAMEAVYTILGIERGVPEVFDSAYDIRQILKASYYLGGKKTLLESADNPFKEVIEKIGIKKLKGTIVEDLLKQSKLI